MRRLATAILAAVVMLAAGGPGLAETGAEPVALLYCGPGADKDAAEALLEVLETAGFSVECFRDPDLLPGMLPRARLLAIGGTEDDILPILADFRNSVAAVQAFVRDQGGVYLGICGGAYLGSAGWCEHECDTEEAMAREWVDGFGLVDVETDGYRGTLRAMLQQVTWRGMTRVMYYQGGPMFTARGATPVWDVVARYPKRTGDAEPPVAAVWVPCGRGRVLFIGPHPEAPREWIEEEGLDQHGWQSSQDLLVEELRSP